MCPITLDFSCINDITPSASSREHLGLAERLPRENGEEALAEAEAACWRHGVLEHLDEFVVGHHGLHVTAFEQLVLLFKAIFLVYRIIELGIAAAYLAAGYERLEHLHGLCLRISLSIRILRANN